MKFIIRIFQILIGIHTLIGAIWKLSNTPEQTMPSLSAIPESIWICMSLVEIIVGLVLVLSILLKPARKFVSLALMFVAAEMLVFCALHFQTETQDYGPIGYWLVTATIAGLVAIGRSKYFKV